MIFAICLILLSLSLPSCSMREPTSCRRILGEMMACEIGLPAGTIYDLSAKEGYDEYIEERVINSLFGEGSAPPMRQGWLDLALFLPTSLHPCELAVFLCDSPDTASDTARLLCRRLDVIRSAKAGSEHAAILDSATVTIIENYVLFIISSDTAASLRAAKGAIK